MKVMEVTQRDPAVCTPDQSLEQAARIMWERDCGCVPVVDVERRPIGMLTDRDVSMGAYLCGRALRDVGVHEVISREVVCCRADDALEVPHELMREHQVRRLPVVDDDGVLVGIVSLADLVRVPDAGGPAAKRRKVADAVFDTYLSISRPRLGGSDVLTPRGSKRKPTGAAAPSAPGKRTPRAKAAKKAKSAKKA